MPDRITTSYSAIYQNEVVDLRDLSFGWPRQREEAAVRWTGPGKRLLEIGFGKGTVLYNLRDRFDELCGVELSPVRVEKAREAFREVGLTGVTLDSGNVEDGLPFEDGQFDWIVWADVIEHVIDLWTTMEEVTRLLTPGGMLVTTTPNFAKLRRRAMLLFGTFPSTSGKDEGFRVREGEMYDGGHLHYFTYSSLERLYRKFGIAPIRRCGFGKARRLHGLFPSLLSEGVCLVGRKT